MRNILVKHQYKLIMGFTLEMFLNIRQHSIPITFTFETLQSNDQIFFGNICAVLAKFKHSSVEATYHANIAQYITNVNNMSKYCFTATVIKFRNLF